MNALLDSAPDAFPGIAEPAGLRSELARLLEQAGPGAPGWQAAERAARWSLAVDRAARERPGAAWTDLVPYAQGHAAHLLLDDHQRGLAGWPGCAIAGRGRIAERNPNSLPPSSAWSLAIVHPGGRSEQLGDGPRLVTLVRVPGHWHGTRPLVQGPEHPAASFPPVLAGASVPHQAPSAQAVIAGLRAERDARRVRDDPRSLDDMGALAGAWQAADQALLRAGDEAGRHSDTKAAIAGQSGHAVTSVHGGGDDVVLLAEAIARWRQSGTLAQPPDRPADGTGLVADADTRGADQPGAVDTDGPWRAGHQVEGCRGPGIRPGPPPPDPQSAAWPTDLPAAMTPEPTWPDPQDGASEGADWARPAAGPWSFRGRPWPGTCLHRGCFCPARERLARQPWLARRRWRGGTWG